MSTPVHIKLYTTSTCDKCNATLKGGDSAVLANHQLLCPSCAGTPKRLTVLEVLQLSRTSFSLLYRHHKILNVYVDSLDELDPNNTEIILLWKKVRGF